MITVEFVVAAGKKEIARTWAHIDDRAVVEHGGGPSPTAADVTFTATPDDADALRSGALALSVGFMRGRVKMAGDFGKLLVLLPLIDAHDAKIRVADLLPA